MAKQSTKPVSKKKQKILEYLKKEEGKKTQAKAQAKAQPKPKSKSQEKQYQPTGQATSKKRVREDESDLSEEDLEFVEKYGDNLSFLGDLDTKAINKVIKKKDLQKTTEATKSTNKGDEEDDEESEEEGEEEDVAEEKEKIVKEKPAKETKTARDKKVVEQAQAHAALSAEQQTSNNNNNNNNRRAMMMTVDRVEGAGEAQGVEGVPVVRERLPFKTPDGRLISRTVVTPAKAAKSEETEEKSEGKDGQAGKKEGKEKKSKKQETSEESDDEVMAEAAPVEEPKEKETEEMKELRLFQQMQETIEKKKEEIALYSQAILASPETNIEKLQKLFTLCHDATLPPLIHNIALLSIAAVFKDIIPGYKIMLHNLADVKLSKEKKRIHDYESQLLKTYQDFLGLLEKKSKAGGPGIRKIVAKSVVALLSAHPHFNFRTTLINIVVPLAGIPLRGGKSKEDPTHPSNIALKGIEELFANDITTGQATLETVRRIAAFGKQREYRINPDLLRTFVKLKLSEDVGEINPFAAPPKDDEQKQQEPKTAKEKLRNKSLFISKKERKRLKKERDIEQELMTASGAVNKTLVMKTQREILRSVFATYFRVIKKAPNSFVLPAVLQGLAQYSHLISVDFLTDVINVLLSICEEQQRDHPYALIQCCTAVFKTLKAHGEALNVDLKEFYEILYGVLPFMMFSHEQDSWLPLINVLEIMIASDRKAVALERIAAFAKRICTLAMNTFPHLSMGLLYLVRTLLARFPKVQQLLGSDFTFSAGTYNAIIDQPDHSGPFATHMWDLCLLGQHPHPAVAKEALALARDDPSAFSVKPGMTEYIYHAYDPMFGGFNPPIPPLRKHRYEKKSDKVIFVRPATQFPASSFLTSVTEQLSTSLPAPTAGFSKYFKDIRKFDTRKELLKLKQVLARHKVYKAKRNDTKAKK